MDPELYAEIQKLKKTRDLVNDGNGETILHLAARFNMSLSVAAILDVFPRLLYDLNSRNESALHHAASRGFRNVVLVLIKKAKGETDFIRKRNVDLDTALHLAVRNNHSGVVELLVQADSTAEHSQNRKFETPLYLAAIAGYSDMIETIFKYCKNASVDGPEDSTAWHAAVRSNSILCAHLILTNRGDLYERVDEKGWTPFHHAVSLNCVWAVDELIKFGLQYPNKMAEVMAMTTIDKKTAHHIAAHEGHLYVLTQLMEHSRDVCKAVDNDGRNILHIAAYQGHINVLIELIQKCPEACEAVDVNGRNILHIAAYQHHKELIQCILQVFPDMVYNLLNIQDNDGLTPLHLLVSVGCYIPQLIKYKYAGRDIRSKSGWTPDEIIYENEDILGDQVLIKNALEDTKISYWPKVMNWRWLKKLNSWIAKIKRNHDRRERHFRGSSGKEISRRRKDEKFKAANTNIMKEKVELNKERTNTQIIVTALIATVTFTVGFTMPGGNHDGDTGDADNGLAILSKKAAFNVCMLADAVGLLFSTASLFLFFISSFYQDPREVSKFIAISAGFNIVSVIAMTLTFITGTYVVLFHSPALAIAVSVICCMFFLFVIFLLIKLKLDPSEKFDDQMEIRPELKFDVVILLIIFRVLGLSIF